jgi:uncharacterized membrane protein
MRDSESDIEFKVNSKRLDELLGYKKAEEYLEIAKSSKYRATILYYYGVILILITGALLAFVGFTAWNSDERAAMLKSQGVWLVVFSALPFAILGIYVLWRARALREQATNQVNNFASSLRKMRSAY